MAVHFPTLIDEAVIYARECMQETSATWPNVIRALEGGYQHVGHAIPASDGLRQIPREDLEWCMDEVRSRWPHPSMGKSPLRSVAP